MQIFPDQVEVVGGRWGVLTWALASFALQGLDRLAD